MYKLVIAVIIVSAILYHNMPPLSYERETMRNFQPYIDRMEQLIEDQGKLPRPWNDRDKIIQHDQMVRSLSEDIKKFRSNIPVYNRSKNIISEYKNWSSELCMFSKLLHDEIDHYETCIRVSDTMRENAHYSMLIRANSYFKATMETRYKKD